MRISYPNSSHIRFALEGLLGIGLRPNKAPSNGKLVRNGQLIRIRWRKGERAIRLFIYKVTGSGRNKEHERRIEITNTYQKSLNLAPGYEDVVLGYDPEERVFVGVDPRRMMHGGTTGNASSFIEVEGLQQTSIKKISVRARQSSLFGIEYHAYFKPQRLAEYIINLSNIHSGNYDGCGAFSANISVKNVPKLTIEDGDAKGLELMLTISKEKFRKTRLKNKRI